MTLSNEQFHLIFEVVGMWAAICAFVAVVFGWLFTKAFDFAFEFARKRGARVSFTKRAQEWERRAERWAQLAYRLEERNRREAARRAVCGG